MSRRILITGHSGFIGSHLCKLLKQSGSFEIFGSSLNTCASLDEVGVHQIEGDLSSESFVRAVFKETNPDYVVHLASSVKSGRDLSDLSNQARSTVIPTLNILSALPQNLKRAVFLGSSEEYGNQKPPLKESLSPKVFSPYGWAKCSAFLMADYVRKARALPISWLRPFLVFGPGQREPFVLPSMARACLQNKSLDLSPGAQTRDFIFVKDLCRGIEHLLEIPYQENQAIINFGTGIETSLRELGEKIQSIVGSGSLNWGGLEYRDNEVMKLFSDTKNFNKIFPDFQWTDFSSALKDTIGWNRTDLGLD